MHLVVWLLVVFFSLLEFPKEQRLYHPAIEEDLPWHDFVSDLRLAAHLQIRDAMVTALNPSSSPGVN